MHQEDNYLEINRQSWNNKLPTHLQSDFYDVDGFLKGKSSLNAIELELLGDVKGKTILHLQCHFGQDSISLARSGAKVTGVDLSDKAIEAAKEFAIKTDCEIEFVCCDIYNLPKHLTEKFDIVFTSYGTIGWLPDLDKWAKLISTYLKPNGRFIFVEFHPVVWMFDDNFETVHYNYFNTGPIIETENGSYANREAEIVQEYVCWNHSLSEVMSNLIKNGLEILEFQEFDYSPYNCFKNTVEIEPGKFQIEKFGNKIPLVYALSAQKK